MNRLTPGTQRRIRALLVTLSHCAKGEWRASEIHQEASDLLNLMPRASDKAKAFKKALRAAASSKSATKKLTRNEVRAAVEERANGFCEACKLSSLSPLRWDHWLGGSGRRIPKQAAETTWMLCRDCDRRRTMNLPSAAQWNHVFEMHCRKYGYRFYAHIEKSALPRRGTA